MNRYIKERGLLARIGSICILTIACMTFTYADQHKNKTEQFMEGILSFRFSSSNINFKPTFIYDELPDKLKNIIELPKNSLILGSLINGNDINSVFSTEINSDDVEKYFKTTMGEKGWHEPNKNYRPMSGGFRSHKKRFSFVLCKQDKSSYVQISSHNKLYDKTSVLIKYSESEYGSPCSREYLNRLKQSPKPPTLRPLPHLINPIGMKASNMRSSGSRNGFSTSVRLTSKNTTKLMQHYSKQLKDKKWILIDDWNKDNMAWNLWTLKDENETKWMGMMFVNRSIANDDTTNVRLWVFNGSDGFNGSVTVGGH